MSRFNSLAHHKFKAAGLVISIMAIVMLIALQILNYEYQDGWHDRIFIINHYIIVFGLFMLMYSKEIRDDERVQKIRYNLLKRSYALTVCASMLYITLSSLDRVQFTFYAILYIIEAVLVMYQLMFRYCLRYNPEWIFKEKTKSRFDFYVLFVCLIFLMGWIIFVVIQYKI